MGKVFFNILTTFAEFESDLMRMRTREGIAIARARGRLRGKKPKLSEKQGKELRRMYDAGEYSISDLADVFSVSRPTIYRTLHRVPGHEPLLQTERQNAAAKVVGKGHGMPIKPELQGFYPIDWPQFFHSIRFRRAKGRCEHCGRPHGKIAQHLGDGRWYDQESERWRDGQSRRVRTNLPAPAHIPAEIPAFVTQVYLSCAHLDHDVGNNDAGNLAALC